MCIAHGGEHVLHDAVVVAGGRAREEVVGQSERHEILDDEAVVLIREFTRAHARAVGGHQGWGVPCSSVPETMSTSWPAIRMYREKTSEGTPNPAMWPI